MSSSPRDFKSSKQMTMKEIHKPSSFEGAVWSVVGIKDARIVYHAPPGCYMMQHMNLLCGKQYGDMYTTQISYANVMMGTEETLEKVLLKVALEKPRAIIIVTSPVIEITVSRPVRKAGKSRRNAQTGSISRSFMFASYIVLGNCI